MCSPVWPHMSRVLSSQGVLDGSGLRTLARERGSLFGEVARIVGLLSAIGIGALLHALRIIVIGAITATPSGLVHIMVSVGLGKPSGEKMYMSGRTAVESQRKKTGFLKKLAK